MIPRLRLSQFVRRGEAYHFARVELPAAQPKPAHRHNFHEVFWVERGQGVHVINGRRYELHAGLCVCIHADDAHSLRGKPGHPLCLINVAFPSRTWLRLRRRYFSDRPDFFTVPASKRGVDLTNRLSTELSVAAQELGDGRRSSLKIERFLINLFHSLATQAVPPAASPLPDWLENACRRIREDRAFSEGVPAFVRVAGRSGEHVARQVRRHLHKTPTEIVNEARLAYAAGELGAGRRSITDIALDCGIENLSHFYNLFRRHFGCTPRRYRLRHQQIVR